MLRSLSIRLRLTVGFATLLLCLCAVAAASLVGFQYLNERMRVVFEERAIPVELLAQVNYLMQRNRVLMMDTLVDPGKSNLEKRKNEFASNVGKIGRALEQFAAIPRSPDLEAPYHAFLDQQQTYGTQALGAAMEAMAADRFDDGQALYLDKVTPMAPAFQASIEKLMDLQIQSAGTSYGDARDRAAMGRFAILALVLSALAGGVVLSWQIARSFTRPIMDAQTVATRVAEGNLCPLEVAGGRDEIGRLLAQLERMRLGLSGIVSEVRVGSQSIAWTSEEIAGGVSDLSQRTELQAANLQQASAGLDQLLQEVQSHTQIFHEVSAVARNTTLGAQRSGQSVQDLVGQIETVGEMSRKIAAITDVIDSIAFQTNILALNAAVEAARAGEQGRGFAVVASEVRTLATRSATAAAEIRTLISDTVDSISRVTSQANSAGGAVGDVVTQVSTINTLIARLNETSSHQASELTHISQAIHSIDEMTQQNAALVEENAAAAEKLAADASGLDRMVGTFQLS